MNLVKRSASRNQLIFGLFERMRLVEQIGSGIARMRDVMKELERIVSISASAIDNNIDALKDLWLLVREGSEKGGNWKINFLLP